MVNIKTGKKANSDKLLTYTDRVKKLTEKVVDLSQLYSDLLQEKIGLLKWVHLI